MTIVRNLGNPTWFVTFTGNPKWPEIQSALQDGQDYVHRADIVCRIVMDKTEEFLRDVLHRNVFGKTVAWCYSVEHQKRGMPHIHLLLILDSKHQITTPVEVDKYVCARLPTLPDMTDVSQEAQQQRRLWHMVTTNMLHNCNATCLDDQNKCKKYFPKPYSKQTVLSAERYAEYVRLDPDISNGGIDEMAGPQNDTTHKLAVEYQRLKPPQNHKGPTIKNWNKEGLTYVKRVRGRMVQLLDDRNVVPYNPYLLLKYGCHINIEFVFGQKACKYIFKYILKGFEKAFVKVVQPSDSADPNVYNYDEMDAMFRVRYMTAMEAYLRLHSHKIVNMSHQIYTLSVHEENAQTIIMHDGEDEEAILQNAVKDSRLTGFFRLCVQDAKAAKLRYDEIPFYYSWCMKSRTWKLRRNPKINSKMLVRIYTVSPKRTELLAIRTLLMNRKGPTSFADLRTVEDHLYETFVESAKKLGLFKDDYIFIALMEDACVEKMSDKQLQRYFAMLLANANPNNAKELLEIFLDQMIPQLPTNIALNQQPQTMSRGKMDGPTF